MKFYELIENDSITSELPHTSNSLFYCGPFGHQFSDSFLTMSEVFFKRFFGGESVRKKKGTFSSFIELVQNVADYNEKEFLNDLPRSLISIKVLKREVVIVTSNLIKDNDVRELESKFSKIFSLNENELKEEHKLAILGGRSLGLLMVRKQEDSELYYEIRKDKNGDHWLNLQLKIQYESTTH